MNYQVADYIIQVKNSYLASRKTVVTPHVKINNSIGKLLVKNQFLSSIKSETLNDRKVLVTELRYVRRKPALTEVDIVSKPSLRVYLDLDGLRRELRDQKFLVISTSQGIMSGTDALKKKIGGEYLFRVF